MLFWSQLGLDLVKSILAGHVVPLDKRFVVQPLARVQIEYRYPVLPIDAAELVEAALRCLEPNVSTAVKADGCYLPDLSKELDEACRFG